MGDIHSDHVREDGTVDDTAVETFYLPLNYLLYGGEEPHRYIRVIIDDNGYDTETRIPFQALIKNGWTPPKP